MSLSMILTSIMFLIPYMFSMLSRLENYINVRTKVYLNLTRTVLLEAIILGMVVGKYIRNTEGRPCWETNLGQELYRMLWMFFLMLVILPFFIELLHILIYKRYG